TFAAFIMTYERPEILLKTIGKLEQQILPPSYILIIDNSDSNETEIALQPIIGQEKIGYFKVGYNSGPAGAAKIGLKKLMRLGYQWIFWGDDDNPPRDNQVFLNMFLKIEELQENG